ncbi:GNAT family N-acetyltransferase [Niameybacter sp.]|uniref:GNAT family N-acetyltransferase n=1 Tax=Niameybacter sp. TaxID=2033640 RepID=UPI002FCB86E7
MLTCNELSSKYSVKKLSEEDVPKILTVCKGNPTYYKYFKQDPTSEDITESLTALPPNKTMEDKYFVGLYEGDSLVAILDLIAGYPNEDVAYIGWFMMNQAFQGAGVGTRIIEEVMAYLKSKHFRQVQLGYIKGNAQAKSFWIKNNFIPAGSEAEGEAYTIVKMKREI